MGISEAKRAWLDERIAELNASGLRDSAIARRLGVSRAYFSEVRHSDTVGDAFIQRMCDTFGLAYPGMGAPPVPSGPAPQTSAMITERMELSTALSRLQETLPKLIEAHAALMQRYEVQAGEIETLRKELERCRQRA